MDEQKLMSFAEVRQRIRGLTGDKATASVCALIGHSRLRTFCLGYNYCGRCGAQLGDSLGGSFQVRAEVMQGHTGKEEGCTCKTNSKRLTWRDKYLVNKLWRWPTLGFKPPKGKTAWSD